VRDGEGPRYVSKRLNACAAPRNGFLWRMDGAAAVAWRGIQAAVDRRQAAPV